MRQWCPSFKNPKTSSWPPFMRTMWAPLQVRNNFILLLAVPPSLLLQQSPIMHTPSCGCSIPAPSSLGKGKARISSGGAVLAWGL